jgi:hypothetical protein
VSTGYLLRILKPTTTRVSRREPGRVTAGDSAEAQIESGMLDLLSSPVAGSSLPLGAGVLPEIILALSAAGTAAYLVLGHHDRDNDTFDWLAAGLALSWRRPVRRGEVLIGRARLRDVRRSTLHLAVETSAAATGEVLMTGELEFVPVREGRALRLSDGMLAFEGPSPEAARTCFSAHTGGRVARLLLALRGALHRLCSRSAPGARAL